MDWHKLQHRLFEMDPVDPRVELERLRAAATQSIKPEQTKDLIAESYEITPGSMPVDIDSVSDFAALAGIRIDEKQLTGRAGQARGSDPMPTAKAGRTKHPLKDKLVGEKQDTPFMKGFKNYNRINPLNPNTYNDNYNYSTRGTATAQTGTVYDVQSLARLLQIRDIQAFSSAVNNAKQGNTLSPRDLQLLGQAFQQIFLLQQSKQSEVFKAIANLQPSAASKPTVSNKIPPTTKTPTTKTPTTTPTNNKKSTVTSSRNFNNNKTTIKEHLLRLLNEKKLK